MPSHRLIRACVLLAAAALAAAGPGAPAPAGAHSHVAESSPADGETLAEGPDHLWVTFTGPFEPGVSSLVLTDSQGREVPGQLEHLAGNTGMRLSLSEPLPAGEYRIAWRILATDGHVTEGTIAFTVQGAAGEPATPEEPAAGGAAGPAAAGDAVPAGTGPAAGAGDAPASGASALPLVGTAGAVVVAAMLVIRRWRS